MTDQAEERTERFRLGFSVKVIGVPNLPSHDSRRWQNNPHLSVSLAYLRDIFLYLERQQIRFYRMAGQLAPYLTHPDFPQFQYQLEECETELAAVGDLARQYRLRLTLHPGFYVQLSSPDPALVARSIRELDASAALLDAMGLGEESVVVIHMGGVHGDAEASRSRFVRHIEQVAERVRARLALENDHHGFSLVDTLWVNRRTDLRLVLDMLHHRCNDPMRLPAVDALRLCLATWPGEQRAKIHFSSPRTEVRQLLRDGEIRLQPPLPNQHSDFLDPFQIVDLLRQAQSLSLPPFDVMLEAKGNDVALLRLREQIRHFAPDLAPAVV